MTNLTESLENRDRNAKKEQWNEDEIPNVLAAPTPFTRRKPARPSV